MKRQPAIPKRFLMFFFAMMIISSYPITCMAGSTDIQLYIQDDTANSTENSIPGNTFFMQLSFISSHFNSLYIS